MHLIFLILITSYKDIPEEALKRSVLDHLLEEIKDKVGKSKNKLGVSCAKLMLEGASVLLSIVCRYSSQLYCQAQPQSQLSWTELALVLISPAARLPGRPE